MLQRIHRPLSVHGFSSPILISRGMGKHIRTDDISLTITKIDIPTKVRIPVHLDLDLSISTPMRTT